jgi:arabinogalactan oligomer/maltooligosaccharide transport system permease protein
VSKATTKVTKTKTKKPSRFSVDDGGTPSLLGQAVKIVLLGIISGVSLFAIMTLITSGDFIPAAVVFLVTVGINWVYLRRGGLPAKYLAPGLIFMAIFQIYVVVYSGYIAFTNYGTQHNSDKPDALNAMLLNAQTRIEDAPVYNLQIVEDDLGKLNFLVTLKQEDADPEYFLGNVDSPLEAITNVVLDGDGVAVETPGYAPLKFVEAVERQDEILAMRVYLTSEIDSYFLMTPDTSQAVVFGPRLVYDELNDTITRVSDGKVFADTGEGLYTAVDGESITPGWRVNVGFTNFERAVTNPGIREPLVRITLWTFTFALFSVLLTFILGLALALLFNDARLKGQRWYRVAMILPYAFPGFLSAFVWRALYNKDYGFINQVLLGGADVPWLTDEWLAKIAILSVNLWLGFPYMFLITTGALQAIPEELTESAKIDGATPWQQLRLIKLPLLLVSVAPLLITSFAFNFNNFTLIYLLTGGGPKDFDAEINVGHTDILISMVYKIAFSTGEGRDFGLASAFSILIFFIVGTISYLGFRRTKTLEDMN